MRLENKYNVSPIPNNQTHDWLLHKHYAHRIPSIMSAFGLFNEKKLVGVLTYGMPPGNETTLLCGEKYKDCVMELNRLIKNDGLEKNLNSWFVSQTFKLLKKPKIIISYSDPNFGHFGYTYQALNFIYTGEGGEPKEYVFNNHRYNSRHIKDYWFAGKGLPFDEKLTIDQNFIQAGGGHNLSAKEKEICYFLG